MPTAWFPALLLSGVISTGMAREARLSQRQPKTATVASTQAASFPEGASTFQADLDEERRYQEIKTKAESDPEVRKLKLKSDTALTVTEAREALITYNRALFRKIAQLEPALKERAELVENAILRMIGG